MTPSTTSPRCGPPSPSAARGRRRGEAADDGSRHRGRDPATATAAGPGPAGDGALTPCRRPGSSTSSSAPPTRRPRRRPGARGAGDQLRRARRAREPARAPPWATRGGAGARVGMFLNRSWRTYVVLLGRSSPAAAFVPVDPSRPPTGSPTSPDAGVDLLVTTTALAGARWPAPGAVDARPPSRSPPRTAARSVRHRDADDPTLHHLHLRLERTAQGRRGRAVEHLQLRGRGAARVYDVRPPTASTRA